MNYKNGLKQIREMSIAGGPSGIFGAGGSYGGSVGNVDSYAPGDARIPKVIGAGGNDPYEFVNKGKKGKKGKKQSKFPLYRRTFAEALTTESTDTELVLNCLVYTKNPEYQQIISDLVERYNIPFKSDEDCVIFEGSDSYLQQILEQIQGVTSEDPFLNGEIVSFIGEMDEVSANQIPGGKAADKTFEDFYTKYGSNLRMLKEHFLTYLKQKIEQGIKVEMEHTTDEKVAREITTDHLWEDLDYYVKLAKMEGKR
jgi:hypothetical protein